MTSDNKYDFSDDEYEYPDQEPTEKWIYDMNRVYNWYKIH